MSEHANIESTEFRQLLERVERLEEERSGIVSDIRDVYAEMKSRGYDVKGAREIIRLRRMSPQDRQTFEAIRDTYKAAAGIDD